MSLLDINTYNVADTLQVTGVSMVRDLETHSCLVAVEAYTLVAVGGPFYHGLDLVLVNAVIGHVSRGLTGVGWEGVLLGEIRPEHGHTCNDSRDRKMEDEDGFRC